MNGLALLTGGALLAIWLPTLLVGYLVNDDYLNLRVAAQGWAGMVADYTAPDHGLPYVGLRPLATLLYAVGLWFWQGHPVGYRLLLLGIHAAGGWAVYRLALRLGASGSGAWVGTAIFLAAAVHGETFNWLAFLPYATGAVLALWAVERHEAARPGWAAGLYGASLLCFPYLLQWPIVVAAGDAARGRWRWRLWGAYGLVGVAWYLLQVAATTGPTLSGFPAAHGSDAWLIVTRNLLSCPSTLLLPLPSAGWLWGWRMGETPGGVGVLVGLARLGIAAAAAGVMWRAWRMGEHGRVAVAWWVAGVGPMAVRWILDSRHLYAATALTGILVARVISGWPIRRAFLLAGLGGWLAVQIGAHWAGTVRYRAASRFAREVLKQVEARCARIPTGARVAFQGLPQDVEGVPLFNSARHLEHAVRWICPDKRIRCELGNDGQARIVLIHEAGRFTWRTR